MQPRPSYPRPIALEAEGGTSQDHARFRCPRASPEPGHMARSAAPGQQSDYQRAGNHSDGDEKQRFRNAIRIVRDALARQVLTTKPAEAVTSKVFRPGTKSNS